jgi:hexosaminidase
MSRKLFAICIAVVISYISVAEGSSGGAVLLPEPRRVEQKEGFFEAGDKQFIWIDAADSASLLRTGKIVKDALGAAGIELELTAYRDVKADSTAVTVRIDSGQVTQRDGYMLDISKGQIRIVGADAAGAFYGAQTLRQICTQAQNRGKVRCIRIEDRPDFANRGVMLDISRDKVPTMETLYELVDLLAGWKINQLQLYTEHTFAYRNHRKVWEKASPMTAEEILILDAYCRDRHIELVPNQNSFGHMGRWLKHDEYRHLAEAPDGCNTIWGWMEASMLSPMEPGGIELVKELFDELLPNFSSRQLNVGCDETVSLGEGKSKELVKERGKGRVYLDFLLKIHEQVVGRGRVMQFWGDIILNHPELIPQLPGDIIALVWGYEAGHKFDEQCGKFEAAGVPFYVCPGTSTWNSVAGRIDNAKANLLNAAINGSKHGAAGYLITNWGDYGHWQPLSVCLPMYAYGAGVNWCVETNQKMDVAQAMDVFVFYDEADLMGKLIYDLGNVYQKPGVIVGNGSVLFRCLQNPGTNINESYYAKLTAEKLLETREYIDGLMAKLKQVKMARPDAKVYLDEVANAARLLRFATELAIEWKQTDEGKVKAIDAKRRAELADELKQIIAEHKRLWVIRNRVGGLADSVAKMEMVLNELE